MSFSREPEPERSLWKPPDVLLRLLHWLRGYSPFEPTCTPRYAGVCAIILGASGVLLGWARAQRRALGALVTLSIFLKQIEAGAVQSAAISTGACAYRLRAAAAAGSSGRTFYTQLLPTDSKLILKLLHQHGVEFRAQGPAGWRAALMLMLPFAYLAACGYMLHRATGDLLPGGREKDHEAHVPPVDAVVGFEDVGGMPQAKAVVMEALDVLLRPERYERLGARCPRGMLFAGPPGTRRPPGRPPPPRRISRAPLLSHTRNRRAHISRISRAYLAHTCPSVIRHTRHS